MSSALANNDARPHLPDRHVSLTPRPCCAHCHHPMAIIKTAKLHLVGKEVTIRYLWNIINVNMTIVPDVRITGHIAPIRSLDG